MSELGHSRPIRASSEPGDRLEQAVKRADVKMLHAKRLYYLEANRDHRRGVRRIASDLKPIAQRHCERSEAIHI
jgi:hypothetical protein